MIKYKLASLARMFRDALLAPPDEHFFRRALINSVFSFCGAIALVSITEIAILLAGIEVFDPPEISDSLSFFFLAIVFFCAINRDNGVGCINDIDITSLEQHIPSDYLCRNFQRITCVSKPVVKFSLHLLYLQLQLSGVASKIICPWFRRRGHTACAE